jgi:transposase-like protein
MCVTFTGSSREFATTSVQLPEPIGKTLVYAYLVTPFETNARGVTIIVTGTGGDNGNVTYKVANVEEQETNVNFPLSVFVSGGGNSSIVAQSRYSPELRERAVRMVFDRREDYKSEWATVTAVSTLLGMSPEALKGWGPLHSSNPGRPSTGEMPLQIMQRAIQTTIHNLHCIAQI